MKDIDKVLVILRKTHDGNDLTQSELYLCQNGANDTLTAKGKAALDRLYEEVSHGSYTKKTEAGEDPL